MNNKDLLFKCISMQDTINNIMIDTLNNRDNDGYKSRLANYKVTLKTKLINIDDNIDKILSFKSMY